MRGNEQVLDSGCGSSRKRESSSSASSRDENGALKVETKRWGQLGRKEKNGCLKQNREADATHAAALHMWPERMVTPQTRVPARVSARSLVSMMYQLRLLWEVAPRRPGSQSPLLIYPQRCSIRLRSGQSSSSTPRSLIQVFRSPHFVYRCTVTLGEEGAISKKNSSHRAGSVELSRSH